MALNIALVKLMISGRFLTFIGEENCNKKFLVIVVYWSRNLRICALNIFLS